MRVQIQRFRLVHDGRLRQVLADRFIQVLKARLVCRQEDQRVTVNARGCSTILEELLRGSERRTRRILGVGVFDAKTTSRASLSSSIARCSHKGMDTAEIAPFLEVVAHPAANLAGHYIGIALELLGPVISQLGHRRLG